MKLFKLAPATIAALIQVDYLGGVVTIPADHQFVAMTQLDCNNGEKKCLLVSYAVEPETTQNGFYRAVEGTGHQIIGEVAYQDPRGSLRRVQGHIAQQAVLANIEELCYKLQDALESGEPADEIIHAVMCPEHGLLVDFINHTETFGESYAAEVAAAAEQQQAASKPRIRVVGIRGEEVPAEVIEALETLGFVAGADGTGRA